MKGKFEDKYPTVFHNESTVKETIGAFFFFFQTAILIDVYNLNLRSFCECSWSMEIFTIGYISSKTCRNFKNHNNPLSSVFLISEMFM